MILGIVPHRFHYDKRGIDMNVGIISRKTAEFLKTIGFPEKAAVISFYSPSKNGGRAEPPVDYSGKTDRVFYIGIPDIDRECLSDYGYTMDSYFAEADELAEFIENALSDGYDLICQCDFGQSRSAACAAAILQHYSGCGIDIFADYRYYPNQLVYHKVFDALKKRGEEKE